MEKICIKKMGVWHSFEKNETAMQVLSLKPFLVQLGKDYGLFVIFQGFHL